MDSITQAALGAAIGEAMLGRKIGHKGAMIGAIIATIPDLDVLLIPFFNEIQKISLHRAYSHSILFAIVGAFLIAYLLNRLKWTHSFSLRKLWMFSFLTLITHMILDAFTSYGTLLFLPFTDWRVSFDSIGIVDPFYTIPLLAGTLISILRYKNSDKYRGLPNSIGIILSTVYLLFTLAHKQHIEQIFKHQLEEQNISSYGLLTVPVALGNMTWYGVAKDDIHLHIGKYSRLHPEKIEFHSFPINDQLLDSLDRKLVNRMKWFAKDFYTVAEQNGKIRIYNMQCDMQGVREYGDYKAPTAFYFEIHTNSDGSYDLSSGMHRKK